MKIRTDFVTNSSSSSFVACGVLGEEFANFIIDMLGGSAEGYSQYAVGGLQVDGDIVSVVTTLELRDTFHIDWQAECDNRTEKQKLEDNQKVTISKNLAAIISRFLPTMTMEQKVRFVRLLESATEEGRTIASTYIDQTDGFDWKSFYRSDFVPVNFIRDELGEVIRYDEMGRSSGTVVIPSYLIIKEGAFRRCRNTRRIIVEEDVHLHEGALSKCAALETVDLSAGGGVIPANLCTDCGGLTSVILPEKLYCIEAGAFAGCANLTDINLPETLLFVHESAFAGCKKLPKEVMEKVAILSDEAGFRATVTEAETYIRSHGDTTFRFDGKAYAWLFQKKANLESWHALYDRYFDYPDTLPRGNAVCAVYAEKDAVINVSACGWKTQKTISGSVEYLIVDTSRIPNLGRFVDQQRAIAAGDWQRVNYLGTNALEKAIELKQSGHPIRIITRKHLEACIAANAFREIPVAPSGAELRAAEIREARAAREAKQAQKTEGFERIIRGLQEHCTENGKRFDSLLEVRKFANGLGVELENYKRQIAKDHSMTMQEYFVHIGILSTPKMRFDDMIDTLAERYRAAGRKVTTFGQLEKENPDLDVPSINYNARVYAGVTAKDLLIKRGIMYSDEELHPKDTPASQQRDPAQLPENIRKRMDTLFANLDLAYPDKVIIHLNRDHKKWGETITALYRVLEYESSKDFLTAYGYTYVTDDKGGRPKKNPLEVIEELQRRYPNGAEFKSVAELKEANPDIAPRIKSLENKSKELFGVSFTKYLWSIGIIK